MKNISKILFILSVSITFLMANEDDIFNSLQSSIKIVSTSNDNILFNNVNQSSKITDKQKYRVDIGINNNYLISSDILKQGYSGIGFFIEPYITKHFSIRIEYDYWVVSSLENEPFDTPFNIMHVWKENYLLKINIYPWNHQIYTQIGSVRIDREIGHEERSGLHLGVGYGIINKENINLFLVAKRNIFVRPFIGIGGSETWDIHNSEISIEITYSIKWNKN